MQVDNYMIAPEDDVDCDCCEGSGQISVNLDRLSFYMGGKPLSERKAMLKEYHDTGKMTCPACNGEGRFYGRV